MNPKVKALLVIAAKNAVNAALITLGPIIQDYKDYNLKSLSGWEHIGVLVGGAILSREILVWFPKLMQWSQTALLGLVCFFSLGTLAQTSQPVTQSWALTTSAVALPGGASIAGTDSGLMFTPSANLDLLERNLLSNDGSLKYFAGGFNYRLPAISTALNNMATNTNFLRVQFAPTASFGIAQVVGRNHYGFTAGTSVSYMLNATGSWTLGAKAEYAHFPAYNGKAIVVLNAAWHF